MHAAEILENSGEIFASGAKRSVAYRSWYGWKRSAVHPQWWYPCRDPRCWEAPEHPPAASLLMGLFLMEREEKVIFPRVVAARDGRKLSWGRKESQKLGCARLSAVLPGFLWLCLCYCAVQLLQHFKGLSDSVVLG